ncbi:phage tail tube protein [Methyloversatilis discipulorum]|uniref:phage tail tube protein n=1 Tax=Methyloversatilis discipulorum TaxID=1119528 RepID=UPI001A5FB3F8|nr:phage tail tube protein [Methyloversatilis discipulorum]MBL8469641.1 hypothetical protein [Methyloversatilis discipulorum]
MAQVTKWSGVAVAVQSALATALVVTAISKASTGVVSYTGTDPSNGAFVLIKAEGMHQVDNRVFRIANVNGAGDTFELEGENTTGYDTFLSGTAEVITFGINAATFTGVTASGGDFEFIDITTIHDNVRKQIPNVASPATYAFESLWDPADPGLAALKEASDNQSQRAFRLAFQNGYKLVGTGYIGATLLPTGNAQDKVVTSVVITLFGRPTLYTT